MKENWIEEAVTSFDAKAKISDRVRKKLNAWVGRDDHLSILVLSEGMSRGGRCLFLIVKVTCLSLNFLLCK